MGLIPAYVAITSPSVSILKPLLRDKDDPALESFPPTTAVSKQSSIFGSDSISFNIWSRRI
jgi:hypothetical protein